MHLRYRNGRNEAMFKDVPYYCYSHLLALIQVASFTTQPNSPAFNPLLNPSPVIDAVLSPADILEAKRLVALVSHSCHNNLTSNLSQGYVMERFYFKAPGDCEGCSRRAILCAMLASVGPEAAVCIMVGKPTPVHTTNGAPWQYGRALMHSCA